MEGRKPTGVLIVMVNNTDPSKEDEFNTWYNETHIPDVIGTGSYYRATRYENVNAKPGEARYLAIYETDWDDPFAAFEAMSKHTDKMYIWPHLEAKFVETFAYIGPEPRTSQAARAAAQQ